MCKCFVCMRICAHIVAIGRRSLVESVPTSLMARSAEARGKEDSVNRSRNDVAGNAKHEKDTHHTG